MKDLKNIQSSQKHFQKCNFLQGLEQISLCIDQDPKNSTLYSNRALFMVELGYCHKAINDLKLSVDLNRLNYISYFNLFSLNVRINCLTHALQDLYCALSAIYLIAARQQKSYQYTKKAIQYASNNTEARILKVLMQLQQGKSEEAYDDLQQVYGIKNNNNILSNLRNLINKSGKSSKQTNQQQNESQKRQFKRLQCRISFDQNINIESQIYEKLNQFNEIYQIVTKKEGLKIQKIAQRLRSKHIFLTQKIAKQENSNKQNLNDDKIN